MGFIQKSFDAKKFARVLRKRPEDPVRSYKGKAKAADLTPAMFDVCLQILRSDEIILSELNFDEIEYGDIDSLECVLEDDFSRRFFFLSDIFQSLAPSAQDKRVFI